MKKLTTLLLLIVSVNCLGQDTIKVNLEYFPLTDTAELENTKSILEQTVDSFTVLYDNAKDSADFYYKKEPDKWVGFFLTQRVYRDSLYKYLYLWQAEIKEQLIQAFRERQLLIDLEKLFWIKPEPIKIVQ